jgi:hypothetical protein
MEFIEQANPRNLMPIHTAAAQELGVRFSNRIAGGPTCILK